MWARVKLLKYYAVHGYVKCIIYLRKVTIYLLTSCNTEERIAQNIYIHISNKNYKKLTATTILSKKRIGTGYKNYKKQCPGLRGRS